MMPILYPTRVSRHSKWASKHLPGLIDIDALEDGVVVEERTGDYRGTPGDNADGAATIAANFARRIGWRYEIRPPRAGSAFDPSLRTAYVIWLMAYRGRLDPAYVYITVGNGKPDRETGGEFQAIDHNPIVLDERFRRLRKACEDANVPVVIASVDRTGKPRDEQLIEDLVWLNINKLRQRAEGDAARFRDKEGRDRYDRLVAAREEYGRYVWVPSTSDLGKMSGQAISKGKTKRTGGWQKDYWPMKSIRKSGIVKTRAGLFADDDGGTIFPDKRSYRLPGRIEPMKLYTTEAEALLAFNDKEKSPFRDLISRARDAVVLATDLDKIKLLGYNEAYDDPTSAGVRT